MLTFNLQMSLNNDSNTHKQLILRERWRLHVNKLQNKNEKLFANNISLVNKKS